MYMYVSADGLANERHIKIQKKRTQCYLRLLSRFCVIFCAHSAVRDVIISSSVHYSHDYHRSLLRHHRFGRTSQGGAADTGTKSSMEFNRKFTETAVACLVPGQAISGAFRCVH